MARSPRLARGKAINYDVTKHYTRLGDVFGDSTAPDGPSNQMGQAHLTTKKRAASQPAPAKRSSKKAGVEHSSIETAMAGTSTKSSNEGCSDDLAENMAREPSAVGWKKRGVALKTKKKAISHCCTEHDDDSDFIDPGDDTEEEDDDDPAILAEYLKDTDVLPDDEPWFEEEYFDFEDEEECDDGDLASDSSEHDVGESNAASAPLRGGQIVSQRAFDRMKKDLHMDPSKTSSKLKDLTEEDRQACRKRCRERISSLIQRLKDQIKVDAAAKRGTRSAISIGFTRIIRKASIEYLLEQLMRGLKDDVQIVLGLEHIEPEDILSLQSEDGRDVWVDSWGVYIDILVIDGQSYVYIGSGTSQDGIYSRLAGYARCTRSKKRAGHGFHARRLVKEGVVPHFRVLGLYDKRTEASVANTLLLEGVLALFFGSVCNIAKSEKGKVYVNEATIELCNDVASKATYLPAWKSANSVLPLRQGLGFVRVFGSERICAFEQCDRPGRVVHRSDVGKAAFMSDTGYIMCHGKCYHALTVQGQIHLTQQAGRPNACNNCNYRGLAMTCDGLESCNNCEELSQHRRDTCSYTATGSYMVLKNGDFKIINEDKCFHCWNMKKECANGHPPGPNGEPGEKCICCKRYGRACTIAGDIPWQIRVKNVPKCHVCAKQGTNCYFGGDGKGCGTCGEDSTSYEMVHLEAQGPSDLGELIVLWKAKRDLVVSDDDDD